MRASIVSSALLLLASSPLHAQETAVVDKVNLLSPHGGLMFWTLLIFVVLFFVLSKTAFGPITEAVAAREQALQDAIDQAKRDREEAARILAEHTAQLEGARAEAQRIIAEGRAVGDKLRSEMVEETRVQQQDMLDRARREIETEKTNAIAELREEAVDLALAGASKVIEKNLDDPTNRKLVESFLAGAGVQKQRRN
jgi:F-type H+-transporting ATPase subunit b